MKNDNDYIMNDVTAQEVALHTSLVICADYIRSWGLHEFLCRLSEYSDNTDLNTLVSLLEKYDESHQHTDNPVRTTAETSTKSQ